MDRQIFFIIIVQSITIFAGLAFLDRHLKSIKFCGISILAIPFIEVLYSKIGIFTTGILWIGIVIITYLFLKEGIDAFFLVSTVFIVYVLSDYINIYIFSNLFSNSIIRAVSSIVLFCIILYFVRLLIDRFINSENRRMWCVVSVITFIIYFITISVERLAGGTSDMEHTNLYFLLFYASITTIVAIFTVRSIKIDYKNKEVESELARLKEMSRLIEDNHSDIRKFKHDFKNIILSLEGLITDGDWEGLTEYYFSELRHLPNSYGKSAHDLSNTKNLMIPELRGLLLDKLALALSYTSKVTVEIPNAIDQLPIQKLDAARLIGILLDNSIEAISEQKNGALKIAVFEVNGYLYLIVTNSIEKNNFPIALLQKRGFSTKGENRGIGLSNLDEIVNKYECSTLETKIQNGNFIQIISFKKERD